MFNLKNFEKEISELKTLKQQSVLSAEAQARVKSRVLFSLGDQDSKNEVVRKMFFEHLVFRVGFAVFLGFFVVGGTLFASAWSLPGSKFYAVKQLKEKIEVKAAFSEKQRAIVQTKHAQERLRELEIIQKEIKAEDVEEKKQLEVDTEKRLPQNSKVEDTSIKVKREKTKQKQKTAEKEARVQVQTALESLEKVKAQEKKSGDEKDEKKIEEKIEELTKRAESVKFSSEQETKKREQEEGDSKDNKEEGEVRGIKTNTENLHNEESGKLQEIQKDENNN